MICNSCGKDNCEGNFCEECGAKLGECRCWVLGVKFDCGMDKCPGEKLYEMILKAYGRGDDD